MSRLVYVGHIRIRTREFMTEHTYRVSTLGRLPELLGFFSRRILEKKGSFSRRHLGVYGSKDCCHRTGAVAVREYTMYTHGTKRQQLKVRKSRGYQSRSVGKATSKRWLQSFGKRPNEQKSWRKLDCFAASAAKFWKRDISSASESVFLCFFGRHFWLLNSRRGVLVHKNSLASYQRCSHSVEPRALTCPFKQSNLRVWSYPNL